GAIWRPGNVDSRQRAAFQPGGPAARAPPSADLKNDRFSGFSGRILTPQESIHLKKREPIMAGFRTYLLLAVSRNYEHTCRVNILLSCLDGEVPVRAAKRRV